MRLQRLSYGHFSLATDPLAAILAPWTAFASSCTCPEPNGAASFDWRRVANNDDDDDDTVDCNSYGGYPNDSDSANGFEHGSDGSPGGDPAHRTDNFCGSIDQFLLMPFSGQPRISCLGLEFSAFSPF